MLKSILQTATFRQSSITFTGTILNGFLGALFYIAVARILGPAQFGVLTVAIVTMTMIADIADIGTNTGLIRFVSSNLTRNRQKALRFLKLILEIKLVVWAAVFIILFLSAPFLATQIFHKEELTISLRLTSLGVGSALLFSFATSALQAFQKYFFWSVINVITNLLRLIFILILGTYVALTAESSLFIYIVLPFFGFFLTLFILPSKLIFLTKNEFSISRELFAYNIPVAVFTFIAAISARLDTFITASFLSAREVGIYGAASQLVQVVPQLISALGVVAAPKFSSFDNKNKMIEYFKKFQFFVSGIVLVGLITIPIAVYLIPQILGREYIQSIGPFVILLFAMLVFLFSIPVHNSIIFYFGRPDVFIWVSLGHLLVIGGVGYFMILNYGVLGAATTVLIGTTFNFLAPLIWFLKKLYEKS